MIPTATSISGVGSTMAILLAAVFAVAAVTKLTDRAGTVAEFSQLRIPRPNLLAPLVSLVELITAAALLLQPRAGAILAIGLLGCFTAVIVATIRSGRTVSCGCLGALSRQPVSITTVARNLGFLAMAGLAGSTTALTAPDPASIMTSISLLLLAAVGLQLLALRRSIGRLWSVELAGESRPGPERGTTAREGITA